MNSDEKKWERGIRRAHRHTQTYIDVQPNGDNVLIALDGKTGERYGALQLEKIEPTRQRRGIPHRKGRKATRTWRKS